MATAEVTIHPIGDRVFITPIEEQQTSVIVTPDIAKQKSQRGRVVAVGPGLRSEETGELLPMDVKVGDVVVFGKYSGAEVPHFQLNGESVSVMRETEILAVIEQD